jgi:hypothetical protein
MDREHGAQEALAFVRRTDFARVDIRVRRADANKHVTEGSHGSVPSALERSATL